ncbi:MAG: aminotransferase class I/II-fold pyridoxal phosphate-dependent enzyme [Anaerovorax sp.]
MEHAKKRSASFHMPGHKGSAIYRELGYGEFLDQIMDCDITEIPGADNLFQAEGMIKDLQERYAQLYEVKESFLLINGTSGGLIAAILATVGKGRKLVMARNCHKSVFNALTLGDIKPVYAYPQLMADYEISGAIMAEQIDQLLCDHQDADAVILPSPNYYGICSDIEAIAKVVHKHNKVLIVDQAHGAHLKIFRKYGIDVLPKSAEESGADIVVNSIHKTLASFTQSAILNLNSDRVAPDLIADKLQCLQSTSPSYLLMASLDINASIIEKNGKELMERWLENIYYFYHESAKNPYIHCFAQANNLDFTKINFFLTQVPISGKEIEEELNRLHGVFIELYTGDYLMCMTGIGNVRQHYTQLLHGLDEIIQRALKNNVFPENNTKEVIPKTKVPLLSPKVSLFPIPQKTMWIKLEHAAGLICAGSLIPYPPGIPIVCPGEKLDAEMLTYLKTLRNQGEKVIGINSSGEILVGMC